MDRHAATVFLEGYRRAQYPLLVGAGVADDLQRAGLAVGHGQIVEGGNGVIGVTDIFLGKQNVGRAVAVDGYRRPVEGRRGVAEAARGGDEGGWRLPGLVQPAAVVEIAAFDPHGVGGAITRHGQGRVQVSRDGGGEGRAVERAGEPGAIDLELGVVEGAVAVIVVVLAVPQKVGVSIFLQSVPVLQPQLRLYLPPRSLR